MSFETITEFLCDNFDCDTCPAYDPEYCNSDNLKECSQAMKKHLEAGASQ